MTAIHSVVPVLLFSSLLMRAAGTVVAGDSVHSDADLQFFENKIRPALIQHCYECHSEAGKKKGGLWLDRKAGWETGGDTGPAAIPGDLEGSLFLDSIRYGDPDTEMPPDGKLPAGVIADFEEWVRRGLPDPRTDGAVESTEESVDIEKGKQFWSFRPLEAEVPPGSEEGSPIDRFVRAKLKEDGLTPGPQVDPESRLRRAKTDLTGFPPTIAEQDEFLADPSDAKFTEMIDRWLASDDFGERWGRHWLDLARYADTSGGGRALTFSDAWRFRDYVIGAFRDDMPLDQLITSHLAGDLLPYDSSEQRIENLIATGFLVLGPHNYENQNKALLDLEIVDEQIDTMGKAFLGMTLGCARCHDHKFDPVPTKDYYSLAGIFLSSQFVAHANVSKWHTEPIPPTQAMQRALAESEKKTTILTDRVNALKEELASYGVGAGGDERSVTQQSLHGIVIDERDAEITGEWMDSVSNPRWVEAGYIHDQNTSRGEKSVAFRTEAIRKAGRYEVRLSYSAGSNRNPAVPVTVETAAKSQTLTVNQKLTPSHDRLFHALGIFELEAGEIPVVTISNDSPEAGVVIADAVQWLPQFEEVVPESAEQLTSSDLTRIKQLEKQLADATKALNAQAKEKPSIPKAMCVVDREVAKIADTPVRIRGVEDRFGEVAPRGFLQVAAFEEPGEFSIGSGSSGRLELARWITDARNPLTARVLANRIWKHLLGRGIVGSMDNFGLSGQLPTHPELLDYLALRLIDSGWSSKALIREIMLSETYSRDSEVSNPKALLLDPEALTYWRAKKRAIDVEAMRDSILALAGTLDRESSGTSLPKGFRSEFGHSFTTNRRSVYVPVFRNAGYEMFDVFDFANPNFMVGNRSESTIATQALFLMNSPMVHRHARESASAFLEIPAKSDAERVIVVFRRTLGRMPSPTESTLALEFLRQEGDPENDDVPEAWAALQRSLFASVDFRFLR